VRITTPVKRTIRKSRHQHQIGVRGKIRSFPFTAYNSDKFPTGNRQIMSLTQNEGVPRYQAIAVDLRTEITSGAMDIGAKLTTEMELCDSYDVSRCTVRAALRELRVEGLASMRRGSGTRVVPKAPKDSYVQSVNSLSELLRYPGTTFELGDSGTVMLAPINAARLSLPVGSSWFRISGIRRSNESGFAIFWQGIFVIAECEAAARRMLNEHGPVHRIIESAHQEVIAEAQLKMTASQVSPGAGRTPRYGNRQCRHDNHSALHGAGRSAVRDNGQRTSRRSICVLT
jgi:DNA-binding GntR family transcriptional regulator